MREYFIKLFTYDYWANHLILSTIKSEEIHDDQIIFWINHIVNAEQVWIERIRTGTSSISPTQVFTIEECERRMKMLNEQILAMVEASTIESLAEEIAYSNTKGASFTSVVEDILAHLINHSTHHRAQIAAKIRTLGYAPPATDYIFWRREQAQPPIPGTSR